MKLTRNPNAGKRHAQRLAQRENPAGVRASRVTVKYRPGVTIAARERGQARMIDRKIDAILAHYRYA